MSQHAAKKEIVPPNDGAQLKPTYFRDPLLEVITAFAEGCAAYSRLPNPESKEEEEEAAEATYGPHHDVLAEWNKPAITLEGALGALRLATEELDGFEGPEIAHNMVAAALAYFESSSADEAKADREWEQIEEGLADPLEDIAKPVASSTLSLGLSADVIIEHSRNAQAIITLCENTARVLSERDENAELAGAVSRMLKAAMKLLAEQLDTLEGLNAAGKLA